MRGHLFFIVFCNYAFRNESTVTLVDQWGLVWLKKYTTGCIARVSTSVPFILGANLPHCRLFESRLTTSPTSHLFLRPTAHFLPIFRNNLLPICRNDLSPPTSCHPSHKRLMGASSVLRTLTALRLRLRKV